MRRKNFFINMMNDVTKNYLSYIQKEINNSYELTDEEDKENEELEKLINLIKIDDDTDYKKIFENHFLNLINQYEDNNFFDFKMQKDVKIFKFIANIILARNSFKTQKDNKKKESLINNNNNENNINLSNTSSSLLFSRNEISLEIDNSIDKNKENRSNNSNKGELEEKKKNL